MVELDEEAGVEIESQRMCRIHVVVNGDEMRGRREGFVHYIIDDAGNNDDGDNNDNSNDSDNGGRNNMILLYVVDCYVIFMGGIHTFEHILDRKEKKYEY